MRTSAEKTSTAASQTATQAARAPFIARAGGGDFFAPARGGAPAVQAKMTVNKPGDKFEQEADKKADTVMRMPAPSGQEPVKRQPDAKLQRRAEEKILRAAAPDDKLQKAPADEHKIQKAPADEHKIQKAPADEQKIQKAPADEHKIQKAPADEQKIQKAPAEEQKIQKAPAEEHKIQKAPADEQKIQKAPADEQKVQRREEEKILRASDEKVQKKEDDKLQKAPATDDKTPHRAEEKILRAPDDKVQKKDDEKIQKAAQPEDKIQKAEPDKLQKAPAGEEKLQRDAAPSSASAPSPSNSVQSAIHGKTTGGEPLSSDVRGFMEPRFNADFGNVRVHRDAESAGLSNQLSARAFTYQNHIFFSRDQYRPGTTEGQHLLAHELTHTIQQGHSVEHSPQTSTTAATPAVQRLGVQDALDKFAEWAYAIPGFRLLTLIMGFNPINMRSADRSAANLLRGLIELMPGGAIITQVLDSHGIINKAAAWVEQKITALGNIGGDIVAALKSFMDSLSWTDIFDLGGVWERAKRIFTEPISRLISFAGSTAIELLKIVKDAILKPLAALAQGTRGYDILCVILGEDPISGEPKPATADNLLGGFMKLIGQEDIWQNIKKGNAVARAFAWFKNAMSGLMGMVRAIPQKISDTIHSLTFMDIVTVVGAFGKIAGTFLNIAGDFISWGLSTIWDLLQIIFDVVKPGLMGYIKKTGAALKSILKNPLPFLGNLIAAAKLGFTNFADNIMTHLKQGLIDWLTGSLEGVYIPKALTLLEFGKMALSILGISWPQIRAKFVKAIGKNGEAIMQGLEHAFDIVKALVTGGPAAAWEVIKDKLNDLKDQVVSGIVSFVTESIVKKAIPKILSMFIPGAGFISAIISIYDTIMVFVEKISKIIQVVTAFVDSIVQIASGNIATAANRVESALSNLLSLAISFLAGFVGLGKVTDKIMSVIETVRAKVDKAIETAVNWIVAKAKSLFASLFNDKKDKPDERTQEQKKADLDKGMNEGQQVLQNKELTKDDMRKQLASIKSKYNITIFNLITDNKSDTSETDHIHGEIHSIPVVADGNQITTTEKTAEEAHNEVMGKMSGTNKALLKGHGAFTAGHAGRGFATSTRDGLDDIGYASGDHSVPSIKEPGTKPDKSTKWGKLGKGSWIPDHQPPDTLAGGGASLTFRFYPHSQSSARSQGGAVRVYKMWMKESRKRGDSDWSEGVKSDWFW